MDPLVLLKKYIQTNQPIIENEDNLIFGEWICPKATPTNLKSQNAGHYTIGTLWFFLSCRKKSIEGVSYLTAARQASKTSSVDAVPSIAHTEIKNFFDDKIDQASLAKLIDTSFTGELAKHRPLDQGKRPADEEAIAAAKRAKTVSNDISKPSSDLAKLGADKLKEILEKREQHKKKTTVIGKEEKVAESRPEKEEISMSHERVYQSRKSILRSFRNDGSEYDFSNLLNKDGKKVDHKAAAVQQAKPKPKAAPSAYNRHEQQGKTDGDEFGLNKESSGYLPGVILNLDSVDDKEKKAEKPPSTAPVAKVKKNMAVKTPIIIVPSGPKDTLVLSNIKKFLENGQFENQAEAMTRIESKPHSVVVERKKDVRSKGVRYAVVDNALSIKKEDWCRVVAVFCIGAKWQFKQWPDYENGGVVNLFSKVKGFYVYYDDQKIPDEVKKWNVSILPISKRVRHKDQSVLTKIWESIDEFVLHSRPDLAM